jgi:PAS domain S-box-containing protein
MSSNHLQREGSAQKVETTSSVIIDLAPETRHLCILLVDDDPSLLNVSKEILSKDSGFEIATALSVDEAFIKIRKQKYDVVVSDFEMPLKNGLEFLKELREQSVDIPFILFTGRGREEVAVKALNLGVDSYINKTGSTETVYYELKDAINKTVERKKSKQLLIESELKYRTLVEKSLQGILITQVSPLRLVFANTAMGKILGYSIEELRSLLPQEIAGLIHDSDRSVFFSRFERRVRGESAESSLEFRAIRKDGSVVWLEVFSERIEYDGRLAVMGMFLDISKRRKADQDLRISEERYRELVNSVPEMVFECDLTGKITYISQRAVDFTGYTNEELLGRNMLEFVVPEDRSKAVENMKRSFTGENLGSTEYSLFRKNGTIYPTLVRTSRIISENKVTGLRGLVIEITERKKAESALQESEIHYRSLAEREHVTNEKLTVIGKLTRHDVRNKLAIIKANTYLLKKMINSYPKITGCITAIDQSIEQTESLLEFSRIYEQIGTEKLREINIAECFDEAASFFPDLKNVQVINECHDLAVKADSLLRQLFYNFLDNSVKHGEKISQIRLHYLKRGKEAKLFYEDDGMGISANNKSRIFSKGFTTGRGTGHGLYLVKRAMEVYGWKIEETGAEGKGVRFEITIPL